MKNELEYDEFIKYIFAEYWKRKGNENLYLRDIMLFKNIIQTYFQKDRKPYFKEIIDKYKELYIFDEARIESHMTKQEQLGLGEVYDFIRDFDFDTQPFNVFITSIQLHLKLYSKSNNPHFGGKLRTTNVMLRDIEVEVPEPNIAIKEYNEYLKPEISNQVFNNYFNNELFLYINDCIILTTELIKLQPFQDGNKRTFRALLNLLFKRVNIPPIFIQPEERDEYKQALIKALQEDDYSEIIKFYYYKICDAIILLDIENSINHEKKL